MICSTTTAGAAELLQLYELKSSSSHKIIYKDASAKDCDEVEAVYKLAGLKEKICSIQQPSTSPELNSQNFKITTQTGNQLMIRRCKKIKGIEKFNWLKELFHSLKSERVRAPEFYLLKDKSTVPYFETADKTGWIFFKYVEGQHLFTGDQKALAEAAEQIGRMHSCFKKQPSRTEATTEGPFLPLTEWDKYRNIIKSIDAQDQYDRAFAQDLDLIEGAVQSVTENYSLLQDPKDFQLVHLDLNSANLIVDDDSHVTIMDFDEVRMGNVYTDISFALHRLISTCIEQGHQDVEANIRQFLENYRRGNPSVMIDKKKLSVAMQDRALKNIQANLSLKYEKNSQEWLTSIPINIKRLKQVMLLSQLIQDVQT